MLSGQASAASQSASLTVSNGAATEVLDIPDYSLNAYDAALHYILCGALDHPDDHGAAGFMEHSIFIASSWEHKICRVPARYPTDDVDAAVALEVLADPAVRAFFLQRPVRAMLDAREAGDGKVMAKLLTRASIRVACSLRQLSVLLDVEAPVRLPRPIHTSGSTAFDGLATRCATCGKAQLPVLMRFGTQISLGQKRLGTSMHASPSQE